MAEVLNDKRTRLLAQVADLDAALKALDMNPGVVEVLELIRRVNRY